MKCIVVAIGLAALFAAPAWPDQYFVSYDANGVYPEECGWTRYTFAGGAARYFDGSAFVIDSRASTQSEDAYTWERPGQLDPGPGELFVMSWRMRTEDVQGWDSCVSVFSDERRYAALDFSADAVHVSGEGLVAAFEPGIFHTFELRSSDMLAYDLFIDGNLAYVGDFTVPLLTASRVGWGDMTSGGSSLTFWDGFSFGVVPEPTSALVGVTLLAVARAASRGQRR